MTKFKNFQLIIKTSALWRAGRNSTENRRRRSALQFAFNKELPIFNKLTRGRYQKDAGTFWSFSHTRNVGGFVISNYPVGIDLEPVGRKISDRAFQKLGDADERAQVGEALHLWVMKEAAFKALKGSAQPLTISAVQILDVRQKARQKKFTYSFKVSKSSKLAFSGVGELQIRSRFILGIAVVSP